MYILGISAYYHDSAAAIIHNGIVIAAAQEERFTRIKHDPAFPSKAIVFVLSQSGIDFSDITAIAFYDKPFLKFERLIESYFEHAPKGFKSFVNSMPVWIKDKLFLKDTLKKSFAVIGMESYQWKRVETLFPEHHLSHAASAFFPSPYEEAAILTIDGVGEFTTTMLAIGNSNSITTFKEIHFPHSLGLLYSAFTYYCGFKVNSGEYKLMGLAPYGTPKYTQLIKDNLVHIYPDGSFKLNMSYFPYEYDLKMVNQKFCDLFAHEARKPESLLSEFEMDVAASIQVVTEEIVLNLASCLQKETGLTNLVMAGGVALNCVANGKILANNIFQNLWIQPASGDAGGAIGAALSAYHIYYKKEREVIQPDGMKGAQLGNQITENEILKVIDKYNAIAQNTKSDLDLTRNTVKHLEDGKIIGWVQGRMEFGPRALGNRSILADPRNVTMQRELNLKTKFRESFRPFAPIVLEDQTTEVFDRKIDSPYMLIVAPIADKLKIAIDDSKLNTNKLENINHIRSIFPAVTHVDYTARIQTVSKDRNERLYDLLNGFYQKTNCPMLVNTSFNVRGEPIVSSAEDAYRCFMRTEMDYLVINNFTFDKSNQPPWNEATDWKTEFTLD